MSRIKKLKKKWEEIHESQQEAYVEREMWSAEYDKFTSELHRVEEELEELGGYIE